MRQAFIAAILTVVAVVLWACIDGTVRLSAQDVVRWQLRDGGFGGYGLVMSAVRCNETVFLADAESKVRPIDLSTGQPLPILTIEGAAWALAADCASRTLYAVVQVKSGTIVVAMEFPSGKVVRRYSLPRRLLIRRAIFVPPSSLYVGALVQDTDPGSMPMTSPEDFYSAAHLGLDVSLTTGEVRPVFVPYERQCIGGSTCIEVSFAKASGQWLVAQPTSTHVGLYDNSGVFTRRIEIASPGFRRTGSMIDANARAEGKVRWLAENSTIWGVFSSERHFAIVHQRPILTPTWTLGQPLKFAVLMNVHSYDGSRSRSDVDLPELPIGQDDEGLFVVDYGATGRVSGAAELTLLRIPI